MNQGQQRISCPRCRANNFLGQANCWQCGGSLPPPEAVSTPSAPPAAVRGAGRDTLPSSLEARPAMYDTPRFSPTPGARRMAWPLAIYVTIAGISVLIALVFVGYYARVGKQATAIEAQKEAIIEQNERMMRSLDRAMTHPSTPSDPSALDPDSPEAKARRELDRLNKQLGGVAPPPTDSQGNVHLRSGGTITREQWERARDSLKAPSSP